MHIGPHHWAADHFSTSKDLQRQVSGAATGQQVRGEEGSKYLASALRMNTDDDKPTMQSVYHHQRGHFDDSDQISMSGQLHHMEVFS